MIYIVGKVKNKKEEVISYVGFDTCTDSPMPITVNLLKHIITNTKIKVINATVKDNNIIIKKWIHELASDNGKIYGNEVEDKYTGHNYVLIARENMTYKLVDYNGYVSRLCEDDLINIVESELVANCALAAPEKEDNYTSISTRRGDKLIAYDIYETKIDENFKDSVKEKYNTFKAKAILLGYGKITFKCEIENQEVKLTEYTGYSKHIILPPFITHIASRAFSGASIETLKLSEGLKTIGAQAFQSNQLSRVEIPESVELIGWGAFAFNTKLHEGNGTMRTDKFKLRNNKTVMLRTYG